MVDYAADDNFKYLYSGSMDKYIYKLFAIDIINLVKTKAALSKNFRIQPSEIDAMPYWEFELYLKALNEQVEEENKANQEQMDKYKINDTMKSLSSGKTPGMPSSNSNMGMPKMPDFSNMNFNMGSMKF